MKIVYLEWVDIHCPSSVWVAEEDTDLLDQCVSVRVKSVGYVVRETEVDLVISTSIDTESEAFLRPIIIPKSIIRARIEWDEPQDMRMAMAPRSDT